MNLMTNQPVNPRCWDLKSRDLLVLVIAATPRGIRCTHG